ncbi:hypothetical protein AVEN_143018-1 [Araneus ventricosus]|uniref:Uncharacterized protein n=1 Tax=Araneus ventricosus TaxID=182803 RepID=A0A4Y2IG54_ARAVE|nr:hypothetical protein AVEN_255728-1 [Araneus ventricosus]GBM76645.1 hypothetical protein AVEN_143018-1 [Araneus ventricosus]
MTAGIVRIVRKLPPSPNTSGRATLTKEARAAGVKSITLNERGWKFQSDIRTFRTAIVIFCLKGRMGRSHIDGLKDCFPVSSLVTLPNLVTFQLISRTTDGYE